MPKIKNILRAILEKKIKDPFYPFFAPFWPKKGQRAFFFKNRFPSLFYIYGPLTSCKKLEKSLEPIPVTLGYGQTDRQTDKGKFIAPIPFGGAIK